MTLTKKILLVVLTLPMYAWGYFLAMLGMIIMFSMPTGIDKQTFAVTSRWRPWVAKRWKWNNALFGAMWFQEDASDRSKEHERTHIAQFQDATLLGLVLAIIWSFARLDGWNLMLWAVSPWFLVTTYIGAVLRGRHVYRGAEIERAAYSLTNTIEEKHVGKSWSQVFEEENRGF